MSITITVGGVDMTQWVRLDSVQIHNNIVATTDSMEMIVSYPISAGPVTRPQAGNQVICADGATIHFAGILMQVEEELVSPTHLRYTCTVRDYVWLLDRRMVIKIYTAAQTADTLIKDVLSTFTSGFTTTNVQVAPSVNPQTFDYVFPSAVIRNVAEQVQYGWYVDYALDVHFFKMETFTAPVDTINFDTSVNSDYRELHLRETIDQERNRIYLKGYSAASTVQNTSNFTGNGSQQYFALGYQPSDLAHISVTRNGVAQTLHTDMVDAQPGDGVGGANDVYVCFDNLGFRWNVPPSNLDPIVATYNYAYPGISAVDNPAAQSIMAGREGTGDGIHEYAIQDPSLNDSIALDRGNAFLNRYSLPRITGEFDSYTQGWRAGQVFTGISATRMSGFNQLFYVQKVTKKIASHLAGGTPVFDHHVEFADSPLTV